MTAAVGEAAVQHVPLDALHRAAGAKMVAFAGYAMPLSYGRGIIEEHKHVRAAAGLFDVSHMGQLVIRTSSGDIGRVAEALEKLMPVEFRAVGVGRQRYGLLTNTRGGILDDLMAARLPDCFYVVVNASRKNEDEAHLRAKLPTDCEIERLTDRALLALQGPQSEAAVTKLAPEAAEMDFMEVREIVILGHSAIVSRSGYTGEDGYEISLPSAAAEAAVKALLADPDVMLTGLGARDSLRLEAGLCLYGSDIDETTTPIEAGLEWAIQKSRRPGGVHAGGFPGEAEIFRDLRDGPRRRRVGLLVEGRTIVRHGTGLFRDEAGGAAIGQVTSGCFGPTINAAIAMGYVPVDIADSGIVYAEQRGRRVAMRLAPLPFIAPNYKRKAKK
jgi:aminomethyltransferase